MKFAPAKIDHGSLRSTPTLQFSARGSVQQAVVRGKFRLLRRTRRRHSIRRVVRVVTNARERLRQVVQIACARNRARFPPKSWSCSCLPAANTPRPAAATTSGRRTISSQSNRSPGSTSHPLRRLPAILNVCANLRVVHREGRRRRKHALPQQRSVLAQITHRRQRLASGRKPMSVHVEPRLQIVPPQPLPRRQIQRRGSLQPLRAPASDSRSSCPRVSSGVNLVRRAAVRLVSVANAHIPRRPHPAAHHRRNSADPAGTETTRSYCASPCSLAASATKCRRTASDSCCRAALPSECSPRSHSPAPSPGCFRAPVRPYRR